MCRKTMFTAASLPSSLSGQSYDAALVAGASLDDLDPDAIGHYRDARRAVNPAAEELNFSDEELLEALGAVARHSGELRLTVAGVLRFGRRGALRRLFPANRVDYIRIPGKEWIEDPRDRFTTLDLRDTLPRLMEEAGLSPPSFDSDRHNDQFSATYLFHHFLSEADIAWLGQFRYLGLGEDEQRALIFVRETGRITNSDKRFVHSGPTEPASWPFF